MKIRYIITFFIFSFLSIQVAQSQNADKITTAFKAADAKLLSANFNENIDIKIPGTDGVFSKSQAELIIKDFLESSKVSSYELRHEGKSKNDAFYMIGALEKGGKEYRTYILLKKNGDKYTILELNIELDE